MFQAKEGALADVFKSARSIVDDARQAVGPGDGVGYINDDHVIRRANRARERNRPDEPKDMDFELDQAAMPDGFLRGDIRVEDRRHLIFATDNQLDTLGCARRWYVDGTFKVMRIPFVMLLTLHAFVRSGDCSKQVPLLYVMMSGRKARDYFAVLQFVKNLLPDDSHLEGFVMDYEQALWRATRRCFPTVKITGCVFHWGQAVWRHVQNLGLATTYQRDQGTNSFIRKLLALPFLPASHIKDIFIALRDLNSADHLEPLLDYIEQRWIDSTIWPIADWCIYGQSVRTNNDVEGWHRRLNTRAGISPPFYNLVKLLHLEAGSVDNQIRLVSEQRLQRNQKAAFRTMQGRVFAAWEQYREGEISDTGLLKKISAIYVHPVPKPTDDSE